MSFNLRVAVPPSDNRQLSATQGRIHQGDLSFSRFVLDGVPFRGPFGDLTESQLAQVSYTHVAPHCEIFHPDDPKSKKRYLTVLQRVCTGWYTLRREEMRWIDQNTGRLCIYVEWIARERRRKDHSYPESLDDDLDGERPAEPVDPAGEGRPAGAA